MLWLLTLELLKYRVEFSFSLLCMAMIHRYADILNVYEIHVSREILCATVCEALCRSSNNSPTAEDN